MARRAPPSAALDKETAFYDVKLPMRCIAPQFTGTEQHRFLLGTCSLREENEIHLIEYHDDANDVMIERIFPHPAEIWHLAPSPAKFDQMFTVYNVSGEYSASLWHAEGLSDEFVAAQTSPLTKLLTLDKTPDTVRSVLWESTAGNAVYGVYTGTLRKWDISSNPKQIGEIKHNPGQSVSAASVDPHKPLIWATVDEDIEVVDFSTKSVVMSVKNAHEGTVRDIQVNPLDLSRIVSCGDDGLVKFWDRRKFTESVKILSGHNHWVWSVRYNPKHDQFVISSSSDTSIKLWHAKSVSSEVRDMESYEAERTNDKIIKSYDDPEDSVYSCCWTPASVDPYVFAGASYDGRVVINKVPQEEIDKVLQEQL